MKIVKGFFKILGLLIILGCLVIFVSGKTYIFKTLIYNYVGIDDLDLFEHRSVQTAQGVEWPLSKNYNQKEMPKYLRDTLVKYETVSFVVIKNDSILREEYWNGYSDSSLTNSFSMAKSIVGVLIGLAINEGKIKSLDQKVGDFIPEFKTGSRSQLTIRHLITMSAGLGWNESYASLFSPTTEAYYGTDLYGLVTKEEVVTTPGKEFNYQSGSTQLLGIVVEKATGKHLADYASEKLWKPLQAMHAAEWSLDKKDGMEKAYCCFYSNARDFARIGSLYMHHGKWNGVQLLDSTYVAESVTPAPLDDSGKPNKVYGYHWWIDDIDGTPIFYCRGILGQYIVVIPEKKIVFVRLGHRRGEKKSDGSLLDMPTYVKGVLEWTQE
jgi:CubicO group peptidase (beta-lactamase class C family)